MNHDQSISKPQRVQFKISHIFVITVWVAITMTVSRVGENLGLSLPGVVAVLSALSIIWLNAFGWYDPIRARKWHIRLAVLGCVSLVS